MGSKPHRCSPPGAVVNHHVFSACAGDAIMVLEQGQAPSCLCEPLKVLLRREAGRERRGPASGILSTHISKSQAVEDLSRPGAPTTTGKKQEEE